MTEMVTLYDIKLIFVQKKIVFRKIPITAAIRAALFDSNLTKPFVGWGLPQTVLGELTALPQTP